MTIACVRALTHTRTTARQCIVCIYCSIHSFAIAHSCAAVLLKMRNVFQINGDFIRASAYLYNIDTHTHTNK